MANRGSVIIQELDEDGKVIEYHKPNKRSRELTPADAKRDHEKHYDNFVKTMNKFREEYTKMDEERVNRDLMYMMLSGKNEKERMCFLRDMGKSLKENYKETRDERGLSAQEMKMIDELVEHGNADIQDALWFISWNLMDSMTNWMIYGDRINNTPPPLIGDRQMFIRFIRHEDYKNMCLSLLDGNMNVKSFAMGMRTEYAMTVGFVDVGKDANIKVQQNQ